MIIEIYISPREKTRGFPNQISQVVATWTSLNDTASEKHVERMAEMVPRTPAWDGPLKNQPHIHRIYHYISRGYLLAPNPLLRGSLGEEGKWSWVEIHKS